MLAHNLSGFARTATALVESDASISLTEYALQRMVIRQLAPTFEGLARKPIQYYDLKPLQAEAALLLSTLAYFGAQGQPADAAFRQAAAKLDRDHPPALLPQDQCGLPQVDQALQKLTGASPAVKRRIMDACVECVTADGQTTVAEAELLRAVADTLGCPLPPLLAT